MAIALNGGWDLFTDPATRPQLNVPKPSVLIGVISYEWPSRAIIAAVSGGELPPCGGSAWWMSFVSEFFLSKIYIGLFIHTSEVL